MRLPRTLVVLLAGGVFVLFVLKMLFDHFTSVHPLPLLVSHHPILAVILRNWPIPMAVIVAMLVIVGFVRLLKYYSHWSARYEVRPWQPPS